MRGINNFRRLIIMHGKRRFDLKNKTNKTKQQKYEQKQTQKQR